MVPIRIARNVPASISPLPLANSPARSCTGRIAYFTGPKNAECTPNPNSTPISSHGSSVSNPTEPSTISPISHSFTQRISPAITLRSASSPASEENSA